MKVQRIFEVAGVAGEELLEVLVDASKWLARVVDGLHYHLVVGVHQLLVLF